MRHVSCRIRAQRPDHLHGGPLIRRLLAHIKTSILAPRIISHFYILQINYIIHTYAFIYINFFQFQRLEINGLFVQLGQDQTSSGPGITFDKS